MVEYWNSLSTGEKTRMIIYGIIGILVLVFAIRNWQDTTIFIFLSEIRMPTTLLILFSMLAGFGLSKFFGFRKINALNKEIKELKSKQQHAEKSSLSDVYN